MKKSELKEIIKSEFLTEKKDSKKGNESEQKRMEGAIRDDRDHIKNLKKDIEDNEKKLARLKKDYKRDVVKENTINEEPVSAAVVAAGVASIFGGSALIDKLMSKAEAGDFGKKGEEVDIDVEDDIDIDDVSDESEIEVDSELAGEDSDVAAILGLLTKAQSEAKALGDEKLMDQIGNTITYYTRTHVVAEMEDDKMDEEMEDDSMREEMDDKEDKKDKKDLKKEELNEEFARFQKLAGLIK